MSNRLMSQTFTTQNVTFPSIDGLKTENLHQFSLPNQTPSLKYKNEASDFGGCDCSFCGNQQ